MQGKRSTQEDCVFCQFLDRDGTEVGCFGIFDGECECGAPEGSARRFRGLHTHLKGFCGRQQPPALCLNPPSIFRFAGHGGPAASAYVCDNLPHNILNHESFQSDLFKAVGEARWGGSRGGLRLRAR